jgi:hypothetical protein
MEEPMLARRIAIVIASLLLSTSVAFAADGLDVLRIAAVFDLGTDTAYGRFGRTAMAGLEAGRADVEGALAEVGVGIEIEAIDTRSGLGPDSSAIAAIDRFLESGGRVVFGAATTGDTNRLLTHLETWSEAHLRAGDEPILLFAPVSTSVLERGESRWSNQDSEHVYLYRVAVSDEQALQQLFSDRTQLRYDPLGNSKLVVSPGAKTLRQNMVLFVEAQESELKGRSSVTVFDNVTHDEVKAGVVQGQNIPVNGYTGGFLENLHRVLDEGYRTFVRRMVLWHPASGTLRDDSRVGELVEEVLKDESVRSVGIIGYADFVERVNGHFVDAVDRTGLTERASPASLWRFTGGTVKLEHLAPRPGGGSGSLHGIHFLRTVPSEGNVHPEERDILRRIAEHLPAGMQSPDRDLAERVDDHTLHAYLGLRVLSRAITQIAGQGLGGTVPELGHVRRRLQSYDPLSNDSQDRLELPFFEGVEFTPEGDVRATRHVFYVRGGPERGYDLFQVDPRISHSLPLEVLGVLGLGFVIAVVVLVNWKKVIGTKRRKVGQLGLSNPYVYGVPVTKPEMYFGRRESFRKIVDEIEGGPFVLLITGGRRSGKSSFLHFIVQGRLPGPKDRPGEGVEIPEHAVPIYIDLQKLPNYPSEQELLRHLVRGSIEEAVAARGLEVPDLDGDGSNEYRRITRLLEEVHRAEPDWMILLLFDEIELLNDRMLEGSLGREFPRLIRSWVQGTGTALSVIFTGSPLEEFDDESRRLWAPVSGMMKKLNLGPISRRETMALASEPLIGEVIVGEEVQEEIYHLSGGQPFLCQAICHMAINALNMEGVERLPAVMSRDTIEAAVDDFVENTPGHVDDMWSRFYPEEQYLLLLMAKRVTRRHEPVSLEALLEFAGSQRFLVGDGDQARLIPVWKRTFEVLSGEKRFVSVDRDAPSLGPGQEGYYFAIDLMRRWLRRKPIWPVIDRLEESYGEEMGESGARAGG